MRMSHQGFTPGTLGNNTQGIGMNSSLVVTHGDLNNSLEFTGGLNNTAGVISRPGSQHPNVKNQSKTIVNSSFDASKSANTINYTNTAYMSAVPIHSGAQNLPLGPGSNSKLSKVGLKHHVQ